MEGSDQAWTVILGMEILKIWFRYTKEAYRVLLLFWMQCLVHPTGRQGLN